MAKCNVVYGKSLCHPTIINNSLAHSLSTGYYKQCGECADALLSCSLVWDLVSNEYRATFFVPTQRFIGRLVMKESL